MKQQSTIIIFVVYSSVRYKGNNNNNHDDDDVDHDNDDDNDYTDYDDSIFSHILHIAAYTISKEITIRRLTNIIQCKTILDKYLDIFT